MGQSDFDCLFAFWHNGRETKAWNLPSISFYDARIWRLYHLKMKWYVQEINGLPWFFERFSLETIAYQLKYERFHIPSQNEMVCSGNHWPSMMFDWMGVSEITAKATLFLPNSQLSRSSGTLCQSPTLFILYSNLMENLLHKTERLLRYKSRSDMAFCWYCASFCGTPVTGLEVLSTFCLSPPSRRTDDF